MSALDGETRMIAHRLLDVVSVHQDERGANPAAVLTAAGAMGAAEDQDGNTWMPGSLLPASLLLLRALTLKLSEVLDEDQDVLIGGLREWLDEEEES